MCQAAPVKDGDHCFWHSPEYAEDVAEARRLGGLRRRREVAVSGAYEVNGLETESSLMARTTLTAWRMCLTRSMTNTMRQ